MKRFMQLTIGVLCLSLSALIGFHLGSRTAAAETAKLVDCGIAVNGDQVYVTNQAGEVWVRSIDDSSYPTKFTGSVRRLGSIR